jgi:hypothetical protein
MQVNSIRYCPSTCPLNTRSSFYWSNADPAYYFVQLLSGGNHDIDVDDLKHNTRYTGGFSEGSRTVKIFWEVWKLNEYVLLYPSLN